MRLNNLIFAVSTAAVCGYVAAAPIADKISSLPGLNQNVNFDQYAGYLTVDAARGRNLFYWYAESQNDPSTDPLVVWLNGGPGCSSLGAFFTENGPFVLDSSLTMSMNPYSWNKVANMIWLEAPAGVGFSYSNDPQDYSTNDTQTASDNLEALLQFYKKFPELHERDFYIAGESYAGHYIPELVQNILTYNRVNSFKIPLKGFAVGNGLFDEDIDFESPMLYFRYHGLISPTTFQNAVTACNGRFAPCSGPTTHTCTPECQKYVNQANSELGNIDPYDVIGDVCLNNKKRVETSTFRMLKHNPLFSGGLDKNGKPLRDIWPVCIDNFNTEYLNQPSVKSAIHAKSDITWVDCTNAIDYKFSHESMLPLYDIFFYTANLKILIYSGDADSVLPFIGTQFDIEALNRTVVESWRPWTGSDGQVAGYVTKYDKFSFLTIKGAGHLVPGTQPEHALDFFTRFLQDKPY